MKIRSSFLLVFHFAYFCHAANILVLEEMPSPSHHLWLKVVTAALATKGHNITVVSSDEDVSEDRIHYIHMEKVYESLYTPEEDADEINFFELGSQSVTSMLLDSFKFSITICNGFIKSSGWQQLSGYPDTFKFDLIIHDYLLGGCLINFMQKFKNVPLISMTAFNDNNVLPAISKSSIVPALNPYPFSKTFPTTFTDRIANSSLVWCKILIRLKLLFRGGWTSTILPPNVIGVGGLQITEPKPLPEDLQEIVDNALDGLILFSLGTNVQSEQLGENIISDIFAVFAKFPKYTFLWKIDLENFPAPLPHNVYVRKWIPQNDILAHNKTKLFITHAGLLSTQESIWYGVPLLGIPVFADQFANIQRSVDKGIAEVLHFKDLTKENLYEKLNAMLTNPKFEENIQITSKAFKDQKETPLERAIWWIEWALRNPNVSHFKGMGQNLNFLQIESVDVYAFLTIIASAILWTFLWISYKIVVCMFFRKSLEVKVIRKNKKHQ